MVGGEEEREYIWEDEAAVAIAAAGVERDALSNEGDEEGMSKRGANLKIF